jgi:hypothetical protein
MKNSMVAAAAAAVLVLNGCAGYRLGATLPPDIHAVHIPAFVNHCGEPQIDTEATRATIQEFLRDGNLRLASADRADAVLRVTVTKFTLEPLRYDRNDIKRAQEYRIRIAADLVLEKAASKDVVIKQTVQGETTFDFTGDLASAKTRAMPAACLDLAHHIVSAVVEYW